jgi:hypothetical protein
VIKCEWKHYKKKFTAKQVACYIEFHPYITVIIIMLLCLYKLILYITCFSVLGMSDDASLKSEELSNAIKNYRDYYKMLQNSMETLKLK